MNGNYPYRCIGQPDNTNDAMFSVLHALVGNPKARQSTRKMLGSMYNEQTRDWIDTNLVHDMIQAYEAAKAERKLRPECAV